MSMEQLYYTDRAPGKGLDPSKSGFQIAACSPGIDENGRNIISQISEHYMIVARTMAPKEVKDLELQLRKDRVKVVPDSLLEAFPEVWSYSRLADDRYALTRVAYCGLEHKGRPGNFFAHTFTFDSQEPSRFDHNPLTLARSGLFKSKDSSESTILPPVTVPSEKDAPITDLAPLKASPFAEKAGAMAFAAIRACTGGPPVVLCLPGWHEAAPLIESILALVPPAFRTRIPFCTNESDLQWKPVNQPGIAADTESASGIVALCGPDSVANRLLPYDYEKNYAVFNFRDQKFSDMGTLSVYARFAGECVRSRTPEKLALHHKLAERLGCARRPEAWDTIVSMVPLLGPRTAVEPLAEGTQALLSFLENSSAPPETVKTGLDLVWNRVRVLGESGFERIARPFARLLDMASEKEGRQYSKAICALASASLSCGGARQANYLLDAAGKYRGTILRYLREKAMTGSSKEKARFDNPDEAKAFANLLAEALTLDKIEDLAPSTVQNLLEQMFRTARGIGETADAWSRLAEKAVKPFFRSPLERDRIDLLRKLQAHVPADVCPEGFAWLVQLFLESARPKGKDQVALVAGFARKAQRSNESRIVRDALLAAVDALNPKQENRAWIKGRVAADLWDEPVADDWFCAYQNAMRTVNDPVPIHEGLVKYGAFPLLSKEILETVCPWQDDLSRSALEKYRHLFEMAPRVLANVSEAVCRRLSSASFEDEGLAVAEALLTVCEGLPDKGSGLKKLRERMLTIVPLASLFPKAPAFFKTAPSDLSDEAQRRWRILEFMGNIRENAAPTGRRVSEFPKDDPVWRQDIAALPAAERRDVVRWCLQTKKIELSTPKKAADLVELLAPMGMDTPCDVLEIWTTGLEATQGDSPWPHALTAVCRQVLTNKEAAPFWPSLLDAMIEQVDLPVLKRFNKSLQANTPANPMQQERKDRILQTVASRLEREESSTGSTVKKLISGFKQFWK